MDEFQIEILTPTGKLLESSARSVKLPSSNGEIGILPGHIGYAGLLGTGVLEYTGSEGTGRVVVSSGFVSFKSNTLTVLADFAATPESIDKDNYSKERKALQEYLKTAAYDAADAVRAREKLGIIEAVDTLISH